MRSTNMAKRGGQNSRGSRPGCFACHGETMPAPADRAAPPLCFPGNSGCLTALQAASPAQQNGRSKEKTTHPGGFLFGGDTLI